MQLYLSVTPKDYQTACRYPVQFAHVAYRIGEGGQLLRQNLLMRTQGGLMSLGDWGCPAAFPAAPLVRQICRECAQRSYQGVLADFEGAVSPERASFLQSLSTALRTARRRLYVPEAYAAQIPGACAVVCTALSGGSFQQRMEEAAARFGRDRLALDLQRLRMDFLLPSPTGEGTPLSQEELDALLEQIRPSVFYSRELCARYFTYSRDGVYHFVLYDDGGTLRQKLRFGRSLGCAAAFLMYPEAKDLLGELLS